VKTFADLVVALRTAKVHECYECREYWCGRMDEVEGICECTCHDLTQLVLDAALAIERLTAPPPQWRQWRRTPGPPT